MAYSDKVIDHYENPRNVGSLDKNSEDVGTGLVGAPACGDVMKLQIKVEGGIITDAKFKTFGCGSAIASSSLVTEWVKGMSVDKAMELKNSQIAEELNLPPVKIHCSVLAEDAIKAAIADYKKKQEDRGIAKLTAARKADGKPTEAIRIGLRGGGCDGFSYVFEWADKPAGKHDHVLAFDNGVGGGKVRLFIDKKSMLYLKGTTLNFVTGLMGHGFKFENPN